MTKHSWWDGFAKTIRAPFGRRPILGAAVFLIGGMLLAKYRLLWLLCLLAFPAIFYLVHAIRIRYVKPFVVVIFFMTILGYILMASANRPISYVSQINQSEESVFCDLTGEVSRVHVTDYGIQYEINNVKIKNAGSIGRYRVMVRSQDSQTTYSVGDTLHVMGDAKCFSSPRNPGEFDQRTYYAALKVMFYVKANRIECTAHCTNPILKLANFCSSHLSEAFHQLASQKYASVFEAMILGNRDELDEDLDSLFSLCGIGHILAISGLHISMLGMGIYKLIRRLGMKPIPAMLLGAGLILFYGLITGNGTSTTRALIMFLVAVYSHTKKRSYDVLSAASLAAIFMLIDSPMYLFHCGFLLSYGAILGISVISPAMEAYIPTIWKQSKHPFCKISVQFLRSLCGSISISAATLPITLYFYFQTPSYAVFLNLIVIPLMSVLMMSALTGAGLYFLRMEWGTFMMGPAIYILKLYEWLCAHMLEIPGAILHVGRPKTWQIIAYYGLLLVFVVVTGVRKNGQSSWKRWIPFCICMVAGVLLLHRFQIGVKIVFLDVGQGDGYYIRTDNTITILVDGGSATKQQLYQTTLKPFLQSEGVITLDYWIMTHADSDHISGMQQLLSDDCISVRNVILPNTELSDEAYKKVERLAKKHGAQIIYVSTGDVLTAGDCSLTFLHPQSAYETEERNAYSTSFLFSYGEFQMLCCGDAGEEQEEEILEVYQALSVESLELLKANHHGSRYSNSDVWLTTLQPQNFVISCGQGNSYGHPHQEVLARLSEDCPELQSLYRTDEQGALMVTIHNPLAASQFHSFLEKIY